LDTFVVKTTKENLFKDVLEGIKKYAKEHNGTVEFVGFGIPGVVINNLIVNMPNIGLTNVDLNQVVGEYFPNAKIASTNDANAAALGEALVGEKASSSYMITLGTGVGGGYIYDGKIVNGVSASAGEIGHTFIDPINNYKCTCGKCGCLETVSSATGIVRLFNDNKGKYKTSIDKEIVTTKDIFDAAKEGDELSLYVVNFATRILGIAIANIEATVDPESIIIGGGVSKAGDFLLELVKKYYKEYAFYMQKDKKISLAKLGNSAGMLGARYIEV
jgi:glucokinase